MPTLLIKYPNSQSQTFPLKRLRLTIGRSARNDVCLSDPFASRVHAEIRPEGDAYVVQDLGSANGTFYEGRQLTSGQTLAPSSCLRIGETEIEFIDDSTTSLTYVHDNQTVIGGVQRPHAFSTTTDRTSGLLEAIEDARRRKIAGDENVASDKDAGDKKLSSSNVAASGIAPSTPARRDQHQSHAAQLATNDKGDLLALISKVGVTLLASQTLDETLKQIVALVFDVVPAERCLIMLRAGNVIENRSPTAALELTIHAAATRSPSGALEAPVEEIKVSRAIIEEVILRGASILATDAQHDPRFIGTTTTLEGIRSVLAVPLGVGSDAFGIIYADSPVESVRFTEDHLKVLTTLASVAAIRVENARLLEQQLERERLESEIHLAREIQQRFQPASAPQVAGYDIIGISFSCYEIGGDYYDFIKRSDNRLLIALGDVSGKGTAAALLMSSLHAAIHAQACVQTSLVETINAVNSYLADNIPANRFITLFYSELDAATGALNYLNAGHNPALIVRRAAKANAATHAFDVSRNAATEDLAGKDLAGKDLADDLTLDAARETQVFSCEQLAASGIPLGISSRASYMQSATMLAPGDVLVIYSDGVTETVNPQGAEFGVERLRETIEAHTDLSAAGLRDKIESELTKFAGGAATVDDVTLVIVKRDA